MINWDLVRNPANWLVVGSMVLIGATMFHLIKTHSRKQEDNS